MHTIHTDVYTFAELSAKAKAKARDWFREIPGTWDSESTIEDAKTCLAFAGFDIGKVYFSGFSSQGDGAQFEGTWDASRVNAPGMREHAPKDAELHRIADALSAIAAAHPGVSFFIKSSGRYSHEYATAFDFTFPEQDLSDTGPYATAEDEELARDLGVSVSQLRTNRAEQDSTQDLEKQLTDLARDGMRWIYCQLNADYDWHNADEQVDETIQANEYTFTQDGKRFG